MTARDPHVGGQQPGQAAHEPDGVDVGGQVRGGDLPGGVHAGVGPPGHRQRDGYPQDHGQRIGEHPGHGAPPGLGGPAGEVGAVVGDVEPVPRISVRLGHGSPGERGRNGDEPAVPYPTDMRWGDGGLAHVPVVQDLGAGGSNPAASAASGVANQTSATVRS